LGRTQRSKQKKKKKKIRKSLLVNIFYYKTYKFFDKKFTCNSLKKIYIS
jgi:hypothetical protein